MEEVSTKVLKISDIDPSKKYYFVECREVSGPITYRCIKIQEILDKARVLGIVPTLYSRDEHSYAKYWLVVFDRPAKLVICQVDEDGVYEYRTEAFEVTGKRLREIIKESIEHKVYKEFLQVYTMYDGGNKTEYINFRVTPGLKELIKRVSSELNIDMSKLIREAIQNLIQNYFIDVKRKGLVTIIECKKCKLLKIARPPEFKKLARELYKNTENPEKAFIEHAGIWTYTPEMPPTLYKQCPHLKWTYGYRDDAIYTISVRGHIYSLIPK